MKVRTDIQVLRGVSVALVLLFHAWPRLFDKGYLGVDVFFVVSGFLITGMILRELDAGLFSFHRFYLRRAARLLPATLSTLIITSLLGSILLTSAEIQEFGAQVLGSITFSANIVLALQSGYFESASATKPLLHMWSLSIEEQFYLVAPLLLWLTPTRMRGWLLVISLLASFLLCLALMDGPAWLPTTAAGAQKLAFFILPSRAWELLVGSLAAWWLIRHPNFTVPDSAKYAAMSIILVICVVGLDPVHPRGDALVVALATAVILLGGDNWLPKKGMRPILILGNWSYSLYLVHWPLFAFAHGAYNGSPPTLVMGLLTGLAVMLAWAQYTFVEQRFRRGFSRKTGLAAICLSALLCVGAISSLAVAPNPGLSFVHGLDASCDQKLGDWVEMPLCQSGPAPEIAVWGDSFAMHLIPGFEGVPIVQMTRSACVPVVGVSQFGGNYLSRTWAESCVGFNESVVKALELHPSVRYVVISSPFAPIFTNSGQSLLVSGTQMEWSSEAALAGLVDALKRLKAADKTPILIAPPPAAPFNAGACNARLLENRLLLGRVSCNIDKRTAAEQRASLLSTVRIAGELAKVPVLDPANVLCRQSVCLTRIGQSVLYADSEHLTPAGSRVVVEGLGLRKLPAVDPHSVVSRSPD